MPAIIMNNIKYIHIHNEDNVVNNKKKSLEDNVYFTLEDIFWNATSFDIRNTAIKLKTILSGNVIFHERRDTFQYVDVLYDKEYLSKLINFINEFTENWFEFIGEEDYTNEIQMDKYIKFNDWLIQFEELKILLEERYSIVSRTIKRFNYKY